MKWGRRASKSLIWSCAKESDQYTSKKVWVNSVKGTKEVRGRPRITLVEVVKNDMSIKEVTKVMTLNIIKWRKRIHVDPN